jgi:hypothetical protein
MKYLLNGVAIVAALAIATPVWAQRTGPGQGAPGPNQPVPGGPGPSSPLSNLPPRVGTQFPATDLPPSQAPATTAPYAAPGAPPATTSAYPPTHRHARHYTHGKYAMKHGKYATPLTGGSAEQLNREEVARLQAGNYANPPAPPAPGYVPPPR